LHREEVDMTKKPKVPTEARNDASVAIRDEVMQFARMMEVKLRLNDHKAEWPSIRVLSWYTNRLRDELNELEEALAYGDIRGIVNELVDCANFEMMMADVLLNQGVEVDVECVE